jgi:[ribosomal protein S18]-alanine N-acetyltransferase
MGITVSEPFRIRAATIDDLDALQRLETAYFGDDQFTRAQLKHLLTRAHASTHILLYGESVAGSATMVWRKGSRIGRLYSIVIDRVAQGRGFGARLLKWCEDEAMARGCDRICLEVRVDNKAAILLYQRHGYDIVGSLPGYYADGSNGLKMLKRLPVSS